MKLLLIHNRSKEAITPQIMFFKFIFKLCREPQKLYIFMRYCVIIWYMYTLCIRLSLSVANLYNLFMVKTLKNPLSFLSCMLFLFLRKQYIVTICSYITVPKCDNIQEFLSATIQYPLINPSTCLPNPTLPSIWKTPSHAMSISCTGFALGLFLVSNTLW